MMRYGASQQIAVAPATQHLKKRATKPRHETTEQMETSGTSASAHQPTLPVRATLMALRFYKAYLSMLMAGSCRFEPTCSQFTYEAVERFGVLRGSWLGFRRLLRCQPLSRRFGFDPVPEEWPGARSGKHKEAHS